MRDKVGFSNRPYVEELINRRNNIKHGHEPSIGGLSKAKSHASLQRIQRMTEERAAAFNSELTLKLSYEWKNVYRSLLQMDVLQKGQVPVKKFNQALLSQNVALTKEEIRRLIKLSQN